MLFCSLEFIAFFLVVFAAYWALPWHRVRVYLLLAASYYFYASWNHWLALIIFCSTTLDYVVARCIEASPSRVRRRALVFVSVAANLGLLCYFKYVNFFLDTLQQTMRAMGAETSLPVLNVILPIGISFYTFEAINYVVDAYRGHIKAERNLAHFLLFILFFPHLVAGPIVRARDFLPQINRRKHWSWRRAQAGVQLLLLGLFKKLAIADRMAMFADPIFADPASFRSSAIWLAVFAYALQIYCDFSGYTDMALGCAHLLGYHLAINFNMPYLAVNISDFWRRWHISLSSWLRDYLFIPLGGSRGTGSQTARNLMVTMLLGGLWHGANWTFVVWGGLHGLLLVGHKAFRDFCQPRPLLQRVLLSPPGTAFRIACTLLAVCCCWVFFRAQSMSAALTILERMVIKSPGSTAPFAPLGLAILALVVIIAHMVAQQKSWQRWTGRVPGAILGGCYALVLLVTLLVAPPTNAPFIYFQF
jgi:alginate O-acetyltransferase complex protein AlgI